MRHTIPLLIFAFLVSGCDQAQDKNLDVVGYWRVDSKALVEVVEGRKTIHRADGSIEEQVKTRDKPQWTVTQYSFGGNGRALRKSWTLAPIGTTPPKSLGDLPIHVAKGQRGSWSIDGDILTITSGARFDGLVERFKIVEWSPDRLMTLYTDQQGSIEKALAWRRDMHPEQPSYYKPRPGGELRDPNWTQEAYDKWVRNEKKSRSDKSD